MSTWAAQTGLSELQKQKRKGGEGRKSKHGKLGEVREWGIGSGRSSEDLCDPNILYAYMEFSKN